ncbi:MAG TPA: ABC transporter ATP-binding protein [Blastocatellia bacterium]|nr:ABC transporter ATP-binding protein [Blastocatellia bacterium]
MLLIRKTPHKIVVANLDMSKNNETPLLSVRSLRTHFDTDSGVVKAVDGVSFELMRGKTLGIVGESGSGKSVTSLSIIGLIPPAGKIVSGEIKFNGADLTKLDPDGMRKIRGKQIGMVFQDPMSSLNPFLRIGTQIVEVIEQHLDLSRQDARKKAVAMLELVGIPDAAARIDDYPHQFSGGMRQRAMIAMALACSPALLIADEPTTALDVTIQAQILDLIKDLQERMGTSVILVSHDLGVVAGSTDRILVMYAGCVMEYGATDDLFDRPQNPYTRALLRCVPNPENDGEELFQIAGSPPDPGQLPPGCPFAPRCPQVFDKCTQSPPLFETSDNHYSACWLHAGKEQSVTHNI